MSKLSKDSEGVFVTYSSLLYCALGIFIFINQNLLFLSSVIFLLGVAAFFHHSFPKSSFF